MKINHSGVPSLAIRLINSGRLDLYLPAAYSYHLVNSLHTLHVFSKSYLKFIQFCYNFPLGLAEIKWYFHILKGTKANKISCSARLVDMILGVYEDK